MWVEKEEEEMQTIWSSGIEQDDNSNKKEKDE